MPRLVAYTLSEGGADWQTLRVREVAVGKELADDVPPLDALLVACRGRRTAGASSIRPLSRAARRQGPRVRARQSTRRSTITASAPRNRRTVLVYDRKDLQGWLINAWVPEDGQLPDRARLTRAAGHEGAALFRPRPRRSAASRICGRR